ncbi:MAG TPA: branched-chain amino acid ABC transporter permease, partial [Acidimicrobiales bacterium]|nr:branched-chain amino acid ABC transporter permease [Acidimicrobiales bacterium]
MLQYVLIGLALGSIYAIASSAIVITYVSSGVLNFAFGSMAYVVARFYFWLNSQHGWTTWASGLVSLLVFAPLLGVVLYLALFRFIRGKSTLIKLVATIGLSVALPPIADLTFGTQSITSAPGLALSSDHAFDLFGTPITTNQVVIYGFLLFVVILGTAVLHFTDIGLRVRAMVDSEAMASISGTSPGRVSVGVWAVSATLAGLTGILVAPTEGLTTAGMTALMAAAFAAVVAARLRSLTGAVVISLLMGVVTDVVQKYLPVNSSLTPAIITSIPFGFILVFLI